MKRLLFLVLLSFAMIGGYAQLPELIYYQFDNGNTNVTNHALTPVGTNPAPLNGSVTTASNGFMSSNALSSTGVSSSTNHVATGWNTSISGSFTVAFWTSSVPSSTTLFYIFGDNGASGFRCFTNGVAGSNNWIMRGAGLPDLPITGAATMTANMIHVVYNSTAGTYTSYVNGVQNSQVTVASTPSVTGSGLTIGGYASSTGLNGLLDEFRWYSRALTQTEITATYNVDLLNSGCPIPMGLASTSAGCDSVVVSWNSGTGSSYLVYGPAGFNPASAGTATGIVTSPYTISGLTPGTAYDVYVADTCANDSSVLFGPVNVMTTGANVTASFTTTPGSVSSTSRIFFFDASASTGGSNFTWDFGDGNTGVGQNVSNLYMSNGTFIVKLWLSSNCEADSTSDTIVVEGVGLGEDLLQQSLQLYPVPAHDQLHISLEAAGSEICITITDLAGKEIISIQRVLSNPEFNEDIDISQLASGTYLLKINDGENSVLRKIQIE